jgi:glycosyltransferase involved in cell wall biosynthesis
MEFLSQSPHKPLLSICIPTYNGKSRFPHLYTSLHRRGFVDNQMCEILVSDNCSTDGSQAYLKSLLPCIRLNINTSNLGFQGNLLKINNLAKGSYLWLLGDDDVVRIDADILLGLISGAAFPSIFVSSEEYTCLNAKPALNGRCDVIPFGFISSSIQPNLLSLSDDIIKYSNEQLHSSPHFFARWNFYLEHGQHSLVKLPDCEDLACNYATASDSLPVLPRSLRDKLYVLRTPWIVRHRCSSWFYAYLASSSHPCRQILQGYIRNAENRFFHNQLKRDPIWTTIFWGGHLPLLFFRDIRLGLYLSARLLTALSIYLNPTQGGSG